MIKISKKAIAAISITSAAIIATATVLANLAVQNDGQQSKKVNPLNRDKNYRHYTIVNKLNANEKINTLIDCIKQDNVLIYCINEKKFLDNIETIVRDALKSIPVFSQNYLAYKIECSYKIKNIKTISVDLVWYEKNNKIKFYDQFEIILETN